MYDETTGIPGSHPDEKPLTRGMGHIPRPYANGAPTIRHLLGAARFGAPAPVDWSPYVGAIRNQNATQRCVGAARARVLHVLAQHQRFGSANPSAVPYPSEQGIYSLAREELLPDTGGDLEDVGSSPSAADEALSQDVGVPLERDFNPPDDQINSKVPVDVLAKAVAIKMTAYYLIDSGGSSRVDDCCRALSEHGPFTMAIQVGPNYEGATAQNPVVMANGPRDRIAGGHDVAIVGWRYVTINGVTRRQFLNAGSWGPGFGLGGYVWLDEGVIADDSSSDFSVPTVVTNWVQAAQAGA